MNALHSALPHFLADEDEIFRYAGLLDSLGIGLMVFAQDGSLCQKNAIAEKLLGDATSLWMDETGRPLRCEEHPVAEVIHSDTPVFDRPLILGSDGMPGIRIRVNAFPAYSENGKLHRILLTLAKRSGHDGPEHFSIHDHLTGVFSQSHTLFLLDNEIHRARRYGTPFTVALVNIDSQGTLSDHEALAAVGRVLGESLREIDVAGRIGDNEFLLILPNVALHEAMIGLERLRLGIEAQALPDSAGNKITICGGVSEYTGENSAPMIEHCRSLLEHAKEKGGNRFCLDLEMI